MLWGSDPKAPALSRALLVLHRPQARAKPSPECGGSTGSGRRKAESREAASSPSPTSTYSRWALT